MFQSSSALHGNLFKNCYNTAFYGSAFQDKVKVIFSYYLCAFENLEKIINHFPLQTRHKTLKENFT